MKRIGLCLSGKANNGGSYQFWLSVVKALSTLDKEKYKVIVYTKDDGWFKIAKKYGLNECVYLNESVNFLNDIVSLGYRKCKRNIFGFIYQYTDRGLHKIKKSNIDMWIAQVVDGVGDVLKIPCMIPIFDLMHRYEDFPEVSEKYMERESLYKFQCKHAEIILADSIMGKQHILESYGEVREGLRDHIEVLPFTPPDYIYESIQEDKINVAVFDKYIFYPAQFWQHKNHINLLKALVRLREEGILVNLILVGSEQNNKEKVEAFIKQYKLSENVKIFGYVTNEEIVFLYKKARALVMPTFFGPTNIPQLEAFSLGCPVATSNIYAIPEQVGDAALLFDPKSIEGIASCIKRLWCDDELCKELIEKGKEQVKLWTQQKFNDRLYQIIENYWRR